MTVFVLLLALQFEVVYCDDVQLPGMQGKVLSNLHSPLKHILLRMPLCSIHGLLLGCSREVMVTMATYVKCHETLKFTQMETPCLRHLIQKCTEYISLPSYTPLIHEYMICKLFEALRKLRSLLPSAALQLTPKILLCTPPDCMCACACVSVYITTMCGCSQRCILQIMCTVLQRSLNVNETYYLWAPNPVCSRLPTQVYCLFPEPCVSCCLFHTCTCCPPSPSSCRPSMPLLL